MNRHPSGGAGNRAPAAPSGTTGTVDDIDPETAMCDHTGAPLSDIVSRLMRPATDRDVDLRAAALGHDVDQVRRATLGTARPARNHGEVTALCAALDELAPATPDLDAQPWSMQTMLAVDVTHAAAHEGLDLGGLRAYLSDHAPHDLALAVLLQGAEQRWRHPGLAAPGVCRCDHAAA